MKHFILLLAGMYLALQPVVAQVIDPERQAKNAASRRVNTRTDQAVDKGLDKVEDGIKNIFKKKKKTDKQTTGESTDNPVPENGESETAADATKPASAASLTSYSKFDFVPGEKVVVVEDFSQDAVGDFPAKWNTNSTGELVTVDGKTGKWLSLSKDGVFMPEFITSLPDNFTLEFDLACSPDYSFYSTEFHVGIASLKNRETEFSNWKQYGGRGSGMQIGFHPYNAGGSVGMTDYQVYDATGAEVMTNKTNTPQFHAKKNNFVKVSIWRQKQRIRVYMNEEKVWDVPRAMREGVTYNTILFSMGSTHQPQDRYLLSNVRLAVGAPDTRSKLITEGKYSTTGILFDVNSDQIKPESYGTLKDIATVLQENATVKVKIIGHTDSDGDEPANLTLSQRRAVAVKNMLQKEFNVDAARLETDGKGEAQPVDKNDTPVGKANNRRVEFIKL